MKPRRRSGDPRHPAWAVTLLVVALVVAALYHFIKAWL